MSVRVGLLAGVGLLALAGAAHAQDGEGPDRVTLTIYNQNIALVEDVRDLNVPAGRSRQEFPGVSASIKPETVGLSGRGLEVVEQNFDYDLLTPDKLMESAVGEEIGIVRTNPGTGAQTTQRAVVLAANEGVVLRVDDHVEVLRDDGVPTRVIFDEVPENLRPRPTLSVTMDAQGGGSRETTLTYLTTGLQWKADYVMRFDEARGLMDLNGWVTITNQSGATFSNALTRVVAGEVNLVSNIGGYYNGYNSGNGTGPGGEGGFGDYYIYPLPEPVTVANNQNKQVGLIDAIGVPATKRYLFQSYGFETLTSPRSAEVAVLFNNTGPGVGRALPAGVVRVYMKDSSGEPRFVGEDEIGHTPDGSDLAITTGEAFDVTVQPRVVSTERVSTRIIDYFRTRTEMEYTLRNARPEPVTVEIRQQVGGRDVEILEDSQDGEMRDANTIVWKVAVPANGEAKLTATVEAGG